MIRVMADRGFIEDYVFWDKFAFKYIFEDPRNDGVRTFSQSNAKILWDSNGKITSRCSKDFPTEILELIISKMG